MKYLPVRTATSTFALAFVATTLAACGVFDDDDDTPVPINLAVSSPATAEGQSGATALRFTITIDRSSQNVELLLRTEDGTASSSSDFTAVLDRRLTIPAGSLEAFADVDMLGDEDFEPNETFQLRVVTVGRTPMEVATGSGTIINDDLERDVQVSASYTYDDLNRLTGVQYSNGKVVRYVYDAAGNMLAVESEDP